MFIRKRKPESKPATPTTKEVKSIIKEVPLDDKDMIALKELLETSLDPYSPISIAIPFQQDDILVRNIDFAIAGSHIESEKVDDFKKLIKKDHNFAYQFANNRLNIFTYMVTDYLMDVMLNSCMNMVMPINLILDENNNSLLNHIDFLSHVRSEDNIRSLRACIREYLKILDISYPEEFSDGIVMDIDLQVTEMSMTADNIFMRLHNLLFTSINDAINDFVFGANNIDTVNFIAEYIKSNNVYTKSIGFDKDDSVAPIYSQSLVKKWLFDSFFRFPLIGFEKWLLGDFNDQFTAFMVKCAESSFYYCYFNNTVEQEYRDAREKASYKYD
jgi:hypothetical protein